MSTVKVASTAVVSGNGSTTTAVGLYDPQTLRQVAETVVNLWVDPLFASATNFHLKSLGGRWDPGTSSFVRDPVTSPLIDAGDPGYASLDQLVGDLKLVHTLFRGQCVVFARGAADHHSSMAT